MASSGAWSRPLTRFKLTQVRAAADVLEAEQQQAGGALPANGQNGAPKFDFKQYMGQRAQLVNQALDASVPMQYPEVVNEAMRYVAVSMHELGCRPTCMGGSSPLKPWCTFAVGHGELLMQNTAAVGFTMTDREILGVFATCTALLQVLAAGWWQAGTAGALPGGGRAGRWQCRAGHAVGVRDGDDPHHEPHPRRLAVDGQ